MIERLHLSGAESCSASSAGRMNIGLFSNCGRSWVPSFIGERALRRKVQILQLYGKRMMCAAIVIGAWRIQGRYREDVRHRSLDSAPSRRLEIRPYFQVPRNAPGVNALSTDIAVLNKVWGGSHGVGVGQTQASLCA